jgi:hypothetical protein
VRRESSIELRAGLPLLKRQEEASYDPVIQGEGKYVTIEHCHDGHGASRQHAGSWLFV